MRILVGYDGSDGAEAALEDMTRAGLPSKVEAIVLSTAEAWLPITGQAVVDLKTRPGDERGPATLAITEKACTWLRGVFPGWQVTSEAYAGSPAAALIKRADDWKPNLIVVGTYGRTAFARFVLGSVAQKVMSEAHTSVRLGRTRPAGRTQSELRILIGLDGSPGSNGAVAMVASRHWPERSQARLVTATGPFSGTPLSSEHDAPGFTPRDQELLLIETKRAQALLRAAHLSVSEVVKEGDPKHVLVSEAEEWGADSVFVGSTGLSRLERFILGSVSAAVAPRVSCSVEVVRGA